MLKLWWGTGPGVPARGNVCEEPVGTRVTDGDVSEREDRHGRDRVRIGRSW